MFKTCGGGMLRKEVKRRENVFHGSCELRPRIAVVSFGGKGSVLPGSLIGIILVTTIVNGMTMIIFLAVMVDSINYKGELR
jgi:hypothetical protein